MRARLRFLLVVIGAGFLVLTVILYSIATGKPVAVEPLLITVLLTLALLIAHMIKSCKRYQIAELIKENNILWIQSARIDDINPDTPKHFYRVGGIEIFISCFGILLDSKVIKYNLDGISLLNVEIGRNSINLTYGTRERNRVIKILHAGIDDNDLPGIIERFRCETGIVPVITEV